MKEAGGEHRRYLTVRSQNRIIRQPLCEIDYLTAAANYVEIHVGDQVFRTRSAIKDIEHSLDPQMFGRIHRQTIVNFARVKQCQSLAHGDYLLTLHGGTQLRMSRRYRMRNEELLFLFSAAHNGGSQKAEDGEIHSPSC